MSNRSSPSVRSARVVALGVCVLAMCGCASSSNRGTPHASSTQPRTLPAPLVLSSEFASGRVIAADGMGATMVDSEQQPMVVGTDDALGND